MLESLAWLSAGITVLEELVHLNAVLSVPLQLCSYALPDEPDLIRRVPLDELPHGPNSETFGGAGCTRWRTSPWSCHPC